MGGYLIIFFLQFGSLGCIWGLVFGTLRSPQLAKLLGNVTDGDTGVLLLYLGAVVRAEHEECGAGWVQVGDMKKKKKYRLGTNVVVKV